MLSFLKSVSRFLWNKKYWLLALMVIVGLLWFRFGKKPEAVVTTVNPKIQPIVETLAISGSVDAADKASIPYGSGRVSWVGVKEYQVVKKWQAVAKMDTQTLEKQMKADLNTFAKQWRTHDQTIDDTDYYDNLGITDELRRMVEKSNYDLQNTALNVEIRDLAIRLSTMSTPIAGVVVQVDKPYGGVMTGPSDQIVVIDPKSIYFAAIVDETEVGNVMVGQPVEVVLDAFPKETFKAAVTQVDFSPSTSRSGGVGYKIHIPLAGGDSFNKLKLAMNGTATIILKEKPQAMTVPADSVIYRDGKTYVDLKPGKTIERREVNVGLETENEVEIVDGLTLNDSVVVPTKGN